ncbi:hypothetical protein [Mucilaginibacter sp. L196]|uniref:hypothetical protein n=1 Tax=Mucilaginibacter sp. L196 TaxID=1641870 RepID=UPI00131D21F1|nr:hypothetical protein [Mucilaginibacter sp. L196]
MRDQEAILSSFLEKADNDDRLLPSHVSLFTALYYLLRKTGSKNTVKISRKKLMPLAKIHSISTYHRCISDLTAFNYIIYQPSYDHYLGSMVTFPT